MRLSRMLGLLVLVAPLAHAMLAPTRTSEGWTADGQWFVWSEGFDETRDRWVLVPARGGAPVELKGDDVWKAWLKQHPLAEEGKTGARSPDGKAQVEVKSKRGELKDGSWSAQETRGDAVQCSIKRGTETLPSLSFKTLTAGGSTRAGASLEFSWSPDGKRVAFVYSAGSSKPNGMGDYEGEDLSEVSIDRVVGPRVQLVGKDLAQAAFDKTAAAIENAGFAPTGRDSAQANREKSVVFAAKGNEAAARAIAAVVPGGATVEALTWKPKFEIVVALGKSAAP